MCVLGCNRKVFPVVGCTQKIGAPQDSLWLSYFIFLEMENILLESIVTMDVAVACSIVPGLQHGVHPGRKASPRSP